MNKTNSLEVVTRKLLSAYKNNMFEEAENIALSMTNEFPAYNLSWKILAAIYAQSGDSQNSIKFSHNAINSDPNDAEAHSNFRVTYLYDCDSAPRKQLKMLAFDHYSGIETLTVQWIADQKQGYARLSRDNPVLDLE